MKRICIYNEKGGVGKTTISYLLAGFLAYVKGMRVCVLDFDAPTYHFSEIRKLEQSILENPRSPLSTWLRDNRPDTGPYDIFEVPTNKAGVYTPDIVFETVSSIAEVGYDYIIFDFPGRFSADEPISYLAANGYIDFVAVPMDTDSQARKSALIIAEAMTRIGVPCAAFWNKVTVYEAKGDGSRFRRGAEPFVKYGVAVMAESVRDIRKFSRDSNEMLFVRSTLCFPLRYIMQWSPSLIQFLEALLVRINMNSL